LELAKHVLHCLYQTGTTVLLLLLLLQLLLLLLLMVLLVIVLIAVTVLMLVLLLLLAILALRKVGCTLGLKVHRVCSSWNTSNLQYCHNRAISAVNVICGVLATAATTNCFPLQVE
jgi:hypothetical protein